MLYNNISKEDFVKERNGIGMTVRKKSFCLKFIALVLPLILCSCKAVEEVSDPTDTSDSEYTASSELYSEYVTEITDIYEETVTASAEKAEEDVPEDEEELQEDEDISPAEEKTEILVNDANDDDDDKSEKTSRKKTETSAVTLQSESPEESIVTTVTTKPTVTAAETTSAQTETTSAASATIYYGSNSYSSLNFKEQKGIWISYLEYTSMLTNQSESAFRTNIGKCFDNVRSIDFNTVYVQVRAFGDAYYNSSLFPTGDRYNGTIGAKLSFDPLEIMIEEAHSRGLSVHAWINPMRLMTDSQIKTVSDSYTIKKWYNDSSKNGTYIVKYSDRWYLNPAYEEVRQLISDGITEIVSKYNVDGVQIDDYFYPTTDSSFDSKAYSSSGTSKSLSTWRTENVNLMVKSLCSAVHKANSSVLFGISPQGSVSNNVDTLYADVNTWCKSAEYCDYILPQIYYGFDNSALPYSDTVALWNSMTSSGNVKLVIGLAGYKIGTSDSYAGSGKNEWISNSDILSRQMTLASSLSNYGGVAIFRYGSLFTPESDVAAQVQKELDNIKK
jgi:uncharacterized lipoprotein YddW (UPF0748 family)